MKKLTKIFGLAVITVLTVIMAVCFAACDDGEKRAEWETYAGTYKFTKLEMSMLGSGLNQNIEIKAGESYGGTTYSEDTLVIELKSDGKAVVSSSIASIKSENNLTWRVEDGNLIFPEMKSNGIVITISENIIEYGMTLSTGSMAIDGKYILVKV